MKKLLSLFLVLALAFSLCVGVLAEEPAGELAGEIVILHTNDVHGAISSYAKVAALKAEYEAKGAEVLLMDAGDYIQGEPYVSVSQGETAIRLMNYVGYDVATIGNHEFDYRYENLAELAAAAEFPIIAANVMYNGKTAFEANKVFELESGVKVGVFGLSTPETATKAHPGKIKGVTFLSGDDMNKAAQAQVDELTAAGCDYIICLGHLGIDDSSKGYRSVDLLEAVTGIDVFIDGHSHSSLDDVKALVGEDCKVGDTLLTSTGTKLATVGAVVISEDGISIESVDLEKYEGSDDVVEEAAQLVIDEVDAAYGEVFAKSEVELCGEKAPGNRTEETNNGDLIADAILWQAKKDGSLPVADENVIAITNGGGIRAAIAAGDITKKDVNTVLPFGNTVAYVTVKGSVLLEALEASTYCTPEAVGAFPQVAGIEFTVDTNKAYDQGEQYPGSTYYAPASINRVTIESINGKAFDPEATYVVVTNDFLAAGGDTYYAFSVSTSVDTGIPMDEAVMSYITEELKGVVTAEKYGEPQGRITVLEPVFTDVVEGKWYYDAVMTAYEKELMNGVTANTFEPLTAMNRAMLVTMLYRLEGSPAVEGNVSETFTDCKDTAYYANAVLWAFQNEIVTGRGETTFEPLSNLTRQEMAVILYNYMKYKGADEVTEPELSYSDADKVASWATAAVAYCTQTELMNGVTAETFDPAGSANRAMGATVLVRIAEAA
ncbi:MAG TPA: 5'-nucleotidase C-terminal domain-containing protein [Candidatus Scatomorpha merdavium]|nr:5'-nucleotidase C-terminal domain-containing protein [Candidatus Scatomorpha merdavium]